MNDERSRDELQDDPTASGDASDHEVNPAEDPGPRGQQDADAERVDRGEEELGRTGAN